MRKLTAYVVTFISIAVVCTGVMLLVLRLYPSLPLYIAIILVVSLAVFFALVSLAFKRPIQIIVNRALYRESYVYRQILLNFTSKMGNILNLDQLVREMLQILSKAIPVSKTALLFEDAGSGFFTTHFVCPLAKKKLENELRLPLDSPITVWLQKESNPLNMQQIDRVQKFSTMSPEERDAFVNLEFLFPIKSHGKLIAILSLGKKQPNNRFSQDDLELIGVFLNQAGVILENALLFQDIISDTKELEFTNKKLIELDKLRNESFSKALLEMQASLIIIKKNLESILIEKYGSIIIEQRAQVEMILHNIDEERKLIENTLDKLRT